MKAKEEDIRMYAIKEEDIRMYAILECTGKESDKDFKFRMLGMIKLKKDVDMILSLLEESNSDPRISFESKPMVS